MRKRGSVAPGATEDIPVHYVYINECMFEPIKIPTNDEAPDGTFDTDVCMFQKSIAQKFENDDKKAKCESLASIAAIKDSLAEEKKDYKVKSFMIDMSNPSNVNTGQVGLFPDLQISVGKYRNRDDFKPTEHETIMINFNYPAETCDLDKNVINKIHLDE